MLSLIHTLIFEITVIMNTPAESVDISVRPRQLQSVFMNGLFP